MELFKLQFRPRYDGSRFRVGFTLVELMVVVVIILLMLGIAIPVLHVMTGSQSEAGASNMIAGMLSRARTDAIGLQKPVGVAFIFNPSTNVESMGEVEFPTCPAWAVGLSVPVGTYVSYTPDTATYNGALVPSPTYYYINANTNNTVIHLTSVAPPAPPTMQTESSPQAGLTPVYGPPLELKTDTGMQRLPSGIGVQTIANCSYGANNTRMTDGYLSVGVILFDGQGRLTSQPYGIAVSGQLATSSGLTTSYPYPPPGSNIGIYSYLNGYRMSSFGVPSQFGLVVFQRNEFVSQNFPTDDPAYFQPTPLPGQSISNYSTSTSNGPTQQQEEAWLDINATPLLINRYTGTLVKGE